VPNDCGFGFDDHQDRAPIGPMFGEPNPENSVCPVELNPTPLALAQDIQLVPKSNNLQL